MKSLLHHASKTLQILVTSLILIWLVHLLQLMTIGVVRLCMPPKTQAGRPYTPDPARRSFRFLLDGTVHQIKLSQEMDAQGKPQDIEEVYDVNNALIERRPVQEELDKTYLSYASKRNHLSNRGAFDRQYAITSGFSPTMDIPVMKDSTLQEIWRYDRKTEVFTGYDRTGKILGCLCKEGFRADLTAGTGLGEMQRYLWWQPETGPHKLLWITQHNLYEINVNRRRVERLVECDNIYTASIMAQAWHEIDKTAPEYPDPNVYRPLIAFQSNDTTYHLTLRDPNQLITVSLPEAWNQVYHSCRFSATRTDLFMMRYWTDFRRGPLYSDSPRLYREHYKEYVATKKRRWTELYRIDDQGNLEQLKAFSWMETQIRDAPFLNRRPWTSQRRVQCLSPGLSIMGYKQLPAWFNSTVEYYEPFWFFLLKMMPQGPWDCLIPSLLFGTVAFWHGRPRWTSKGQAVFWLVFVLCLNLAGLLTYLALNHTPLIRCTSCRKKRSLAADACVRCHAPLPLPKHTRPHLLPLRSSC